MGDPSKTLVLNVDDYEPGRYARTHVLRQAGFEVAEAATGNDALHLMATERPGVVLLDINLPDMTGYEVCRRLKDDPRTSSVPVLHISATFVKPADRVIGLEGGADAYLTEPVEAPVLIATVKALLRMRRAEEALHASVRQWQTTFDAITHGVALLNVAGEIRQCNAGFMRILGRSFQDLVGRRIVDVWEIPPDRSQQHPFLRLLESQCRETAELRAGDRWFYLTADPVIGEGGQFLGCVFLVADTTEHKRAEAERERLLAQAEAARVEAEAANRAKDEFLATLSHEMRAPLNAILMWVTLLRTGGLDAAAAARGLEIIERNAKAEAQLIIDLLDVSRIISGKLELDVRRIDLAPLIQAALDSVRPAIDAKGLTLDVALSNTGPVAGDVHRLQQVIANLFSNAIKFTPAGGRITVRAESTGSHARIVVGDTGQGISASFLPYVFDRFRQADGSAARSYAGLGLGLAIVRHLVELHQGTVRAESPGENLGATFTVELPLLPLLEAGGDPDGPAGTAKNDVSLGGVHVLVVDDQADDREALVFSLERFGAQVTSAGSAAEAIAVLDSIRPDVLVSDLGMPGEDGYALIRRIRAGEPKRGRDVPAVALTAYASTEDRDRVLAAGYHAHLPKPVETDHLARVIADLAGRNPR